VSGVPYHRLVEERVLARAGLTRTGFLRSDELPGDAALGYLGDDSDRTNVLHLPVRGNGDGGIYSTAADLSKLWAALVDGRIVAPATVELMTSSHSDETDEDMRYGLGMYLETEGPELIVTGYDAGLRAYRYAVNQRFGTPSGRRNPFGAPFQLALRGQVTLGTDPAKAQLQALTGNGGADSLEVVKRRLLRQVPYPLDTLLERADSLGLALTAPQRDAVHAAAAQYRVFVDARGDEIARMLTANNGRPDMGALGPRLQEINLAIVRELQRSLKTVEAALTPAQWAKLPDRIKFPFGQQGGT